MPRLHIYNTLLCLEHGLQSKLLGIFFRIDSANLALG